MRPFPILLPLAGAAVLGACSPRAEPEPVMEPLPLSADMMANLMAADGAAHTVAVLTGPADPTAIDQVYAGVATGDPEWLALVPALHPALEGAHSERLQRALTAALPLNAPGVLALAPEYADLALVCRTGGSQDAGPVLARAAVQAIDARALQTERTACLRVLDATAHTLPRR